MTATVYTILEAARTDEVREDAGHVHPGLRSLLGRCPAASTSQHEGDLRTAASPGSPSAGSRAITR